MAVTAVGNRPRTARFPASEPFNPLPVAPIQIYTTMPFRITVTPTVDDRRNEIRTAVGRFEREVSTAFTKETLAAVCGAVGDGVDTERLPSKPEMRARILDAIDVERDAESDRPFRKAELDAIVDALG